MFSFFLCFFPLSLSLPFSLSLFPSLTLAKINAFNLNPSLSEGGFSSHHHCFAAFLTGAIDLINSNFRSESPNGKQMWAGAALAKQCLPSKQYWNITLPCLQKKAEGTAALPLGRAQAAGGARQGWTPRVPRQAGRDLGALAAELCCRSDILRLCEHCVGGGTGGEGQVVQRSGTRAVAQASLMWALEGVACQSFWQKKNCYRWQLPAGNEQQKQRNSWQKLWRGRGKKHFQCTHFVFSVQAKPVIKSPNEQLH